ncbi:hypothetical protein [Okeania sp.]|uniref:hypothetical protein n=1 Tax=Okeania sp. TaxID=3100323 RepID=UPI002B4ACD2C|nr:hypothetical protein [Okeania sp.]MEB3342335.1 hypothetical protein [Okeania sp.]
MSEKPVFKINKKLFDQLNNWQEKMEVKEKYEIEIETNQQGKKFSYSWKKKD